MKRLILILLLSGCTSTMPVPPCPEYSGPDIVEVKVEVPVTLPTPVPPRLFENPSSLSEAAQNWIELVRAYLEAIAIIEGNNEVASNTER